MNTLTITEAQELGRIFAKNGTGIDVVRKLALQYPHLSGHQLTNVATAWEQLQTKGGAPTVTEAAAEIDPRLMEAALQLQAKVNATEVDLEHATTSDLHATIGARFG
jgi:hypothetical protein